LPPSDTVRQQKKNIFEDLFSSVLSQLKKYHPSGGILKSLKLRILDRKILPISLKLNFIPNTLGCKGLNRLSASCLALPGLATKDGTQEVENSTFEVYTVSVLQNIKRTKNIVLSQSQSQLFFNNGNPQLVRKVS